MKPENHNFEKEFHLPNLRFGVPPISFRGSVVVAFNQLSGEPLKEFTFQSQRRYQRCHCPISWGKPQTRGLDFPIRDDKMWLGKKNPPPPPPEFFHLGGNRSVVPPPKRITHHPLDLPIFFDTFEGKNGDPKSLQSSKKTQVFWFVCRFIFWALKHGSRYECFLDFYGFYIQGT